MNRRVLLLLLLIVVAGGGAAAILILKNQPQQQGPTETPAPNPGETSVVPSTPVIVNTIKIVVAIQTLNRGIDIPSNGVDTRSWPVDALPPGYKVNTTDVIHKLARTTIPAGSPITEGLIVDNLGAISAAGSDAAAVIPANLVAIAVPIDRLSNVAHAPRDGDYVDVIVSFLFVDVDEQFQSILPNRITLTTIGQDGTIKTTTGLEGRVETVGEFTSPIVLGPSERQRPRLVTQNTIKHAFVVHVGTFPGDGDFLPRRPTPTPPPVTPGGEPTATPLPGPTATPNVYNPDLITLAVSPQDAVTLTWIIEAGLPITLTLRSAQEGAAPFDTTTDNVTLEYITQTYRIKQPGKLNYALEPRISSIRNLLRVVETSLVPLDTTTTTTGGGGK